MEIPFYYWRLIDLGDKPALARELLKDHNAFRDLFKIDLFGYRVKHRPKNTDSSSAPNISKARLFLKLGVPTPNTNS
jgi:hypothetical protein